MRTFPKIGMTLFCVILCAYIGFTSNRSIVIQDAILAVTLSYTHPQTGEQVTFKTDSRKTNGAEWPASAKQWSVPSGVELRIDMEYKNLGDNPFSDGFSVDLWYDWNKNQYPPDTEECDFVCVEEDPLDCQQFTTTIHMDPEFPGKDGKGIYNIAAWVDRFDMQTERDEKNNFLGPIQIKPLLTAVQKPLKIKMRKIGPVKVKPVKKLHLHKKFVKPQFQTFHFQLQPSRSKQSFSFSPHQPVNVHIKIEWRKGDAPLQAVLRDETHSRILDRTKGTAPLDLRFQQSKKSGIEKISVLVSSSSRTVTAGRIMVRYLK